MLDKNALISVLVNPRPKLLKSLVQLTLFDDDNPRWLLAAGLKRTWFVDPVTLQLLKDLPVKELPPIIHETLNENITWAIKALNYFFKLTAEACGIEHKKITSLSSWLEAHQTRLALNLPPYLLHFAAGKHKTTSLSEHTYLRLKHFNQDHREIRFQRGEELVYKKFICLVQSWLPKEMILKEDYELYKESARYWIAVKFKPTEVGTPEGEAAHSLHFAVLVAFIHSKISVG